jgi:uncharacterized protein YkwD
MVYKPHNFRALSKPKTIPKNHHQHYWPYIPLLLLVLGTLFVTLLQPVQHHGVLSYATEMSTSELLTATNNQREQNGAGDLALNSKLGAAAQTKANDMVARNYWSHNTPDGQEPWVFVQSSGYSYLKAGENLAYGFLTSDKTIDGWMNSPSHRENLLDTSFTEVGFGYANAEDFNHSGQETVVVAMYGKPQVLAASQSAPVPNTPAAQVTPVASTPTLTTAPVAPIATAKAKSASKPVTTSEPVIEPASHTVSRVDNWTNGRLPWLTFGLGILLGLSIMLLLLKHAAGLRHLVRGSEQFILHHSLLDVVLVSLVLVCSFLSQTTGFIR